MLQPGVQSDYLELHSFLFAMFPDLYTPSDNVFFADVESTSLFRVVQPEDGLTPQPLKQSNVKYPIL